MAKPPRRNWQEERGGRIDPNGDPLESPLDADERVDQAIAESFPASDPPSSNAGVDEIDES
jgi:hypothetical protein